MPLNSIEFAETKYETRRQQRVLFVLIICFTGKVTDSAALTTPLSLVAPPSPAGESATPAVSDTDLTNQAKDAGKNQLHSHTRKSPAAEENEFEARKVSDDLMLSSQEGKLPLEARSQLPMEETEANKSEGLQVQTQNPRALQEAENPGLLTWSWIGGETKQLATTPANWKVADETSQGITLAKLTTLFPNVSSFHSGGVNTNPEERHDKHSAVQSENTDLHGEGGVSATENNHSQSEDVSAVHYSTNFENAKRDSQTSYSERNEYPVEGDYTENNSNRDVPSYSGNIHRDYSQSSNYEKDSRFAVTQAEVSVHDDLKKGPDVQIYNRVQPPLLYFVSSNGSHNHEQLDTLNEFQGDTVHEKPNASGSLEAEKPSYYLSTAVDKIKFDMSPHFSANSSTIPSSGKEEEFVKIDIPYSVEEANHELDEGSRLVYGNNHSLPSSVFSNIFEYFDNFYANSTVTSDELYDDDQYNDESYYDDSSDQDYSEIFMNQDEQLPAPMKFSVSSLEDDEQRKVDTHTANHSTKTAKETSVNKFSQLPAYFTVVNDSSTTEIFPSYTEQTPIVVGLSVVSPNVIRKISEQLIDIERPVTGPTRSPLLRNSTQPQQTESSEPEHSENIKVRPTVSYELISSSNNNFEALFGTQDSSSSAVQNKPSKSEQNSVVLDGSSQSSQNASLQATLLMTPAMAETEPPVTNYYPLNHNGTTERVDKVTWLPLTTDANRVWSATDAFGIPALNLKLSDLTETKPSENMTHVNANAAQTLQSVSGVELTDHNQTITSSTSIPDNFMNYLLSMNYPAISEQPSLKPSQKQSNESVNYTQNSDNKGLHNSSYFSPVQLLNNTFDFSLSSNSASQENSMEGSDPQILINNLTTLLSQSQNQGSINSWSLLESLVNSSSYTPPTLDIDCEIFGPLSPIVDFYGNLFPGLENPCKNPSLQKEHEGPENKVFNGSEEIYLVSSPLPNLGSSAEENTATSPVLSSHNLPSNAFASAVNHDYLSSFTDFSSDVVNKTFASLLDETSSAFKNAYPIKHLPLPSEEQIEKWWEPLTQVTAAPVLENIASIINVNAPAFDGEVSTHTSTETHSLKNVDNEYVGQDDWKNITGKLPSFISEKFTQSPNSGGVTAQVSNNLPYSVLPNPSHGDLRTNIATDKDPEIEKPITTESSLSTALSIVGYKAQTTVTMTPGGGSTIVIKSKNTNSKPPEVHIPAPVDVFSHFSPASTSTATPIKSPSSFWDIFTNPEIVRSFPDAEDPFSHQNSSSEAETSGRENESSLALTSEPHSNATELPLQNSNTKIAVNPPEQRGSHPTTQIATPASVPVLGNNESYESVPSIPFLSQHNDSSLPKSSSEDIWTSLYQQWISVSQRNSSMSTTETSTMRSFDTVPTTVMTDLSSHISTFPSRQEAALYTASSERTSKKPAQDTVFDKTGTRTTAPDVISSEFAESNVESDKPYLTETTTEVEFDDVLGSLWELNVKDEKKVKLPENVPTVKFPPVRFTISQAPTRIPLYC
ncbi:serine-rich adhesin for platelets-like [Macrobrachium rosenbergii]|uniref:serine-rich adhesin for platelets-like n=1 Tax=Macrobrachium rosenbergii TaxID=79674 RepID=UPI0034D68A22